MSNTRSDHRSVAPALPYFIYCSSFESSARRMERSGIRGLKLKTNTSGFSFQNFMSKLFNSYLKIFI